MGKTRYNFFDTVWNDSLNHTQKGMPSVDLQTTFSFSDDILYTIPLEQQYRPDLVASQFYGDPTLYWILVYVNNFANSPEDFTTGTIIRVPQFARILEIV